MHQAVLIVSLPLYLQERGWVHQKIIGLRRNRTPGVAIALLRDAPKGHHGLGKWIKSS